MVEKVEVSEDLLYEGKENNFMDVDRMVNEGLGGGIVHTNRLADNKAPSNGLIGETTTDTMDEGKRLRRLV